MGDQESGLDRESRRVQLEVLQSRIALHGTRMWQLPVTYWGVILVALSSLDTGSPTWLLRTVLGGIAGLGILLLYALTGSREGYVRTALHMQRVERELGLIVTTHGPRSHIWPYFGLIGAGVLLSCGAIYFTY